ncbi:MAG: molybdopterin-binding protein, partial [Planctomycetota bacterium]
MKATIISTGEELTCGRAVDTNASFLAAELTHLGFDVHRLLAVGDAAALLRDEVVRATQDSALVVITGGLGPTADDRARGAIAEAAGCELVEDADSRRHVVERLRSFGREATEGHLRQARF